MSTYIPLIKRPRWIDLSDEHKEFRVNQLETTVYEACVERKEKQPLMIQGAFGIGKTNSLYYLFHYAWCQLKVPTFLISLEELVFYFEELAKTKNSGKIDNSEIGPFLTGLINNQINQLRTEDWNNVGDIFFEDFQNGNLNEYLKSFDSLQLTTYNDTSFEEQTFNVFDKQVILEALESGNKPLLLIDEFEAKFYKLKNLIDSAGGGYLKKLFDQIVKEPENAAFYLVIGNGPASGYEIAKEKGDEGGESETASNRRLDTQPVPFPTTRLLSNSFLRNEPKGYINFIWWLSRCRPGHVQKLYNTLKGYSKVERLDYNDFINKDIFREPIDEGGETVTYYKTTFFDSLPGKLEGPILKQLLSFFQPHKVKITEIKDELKQCVDLFYCSTQTLDIERDLLPALKEDIFGNKLKTLKEAGRFLEVYWNDYLRKYFKYILDGISDENGHIAFGMINESHVDSTLAKTFVLPLLELTYDFISLYNDESLQKTKQNLDFIRELITWINEAIDQEKGVDSILPETFELFKTTLLRKQDEVNLQISLFAIRQSIEQPIGSPQLPYKSKRVESLLDELPGSEELPLIYHKEKNLHTYFIPNLSEDMQIKYLNRLEDYLNAIYNEKFHKAGETLVRVLYIENTTPIEAFKSAILFIDGDTARPEPIFSLKKFDVVPINSFQLNFMSQISDYLDSVCKIGIIGTIRKDLLIGIKDNDAIILKLNDIIKVISERTWMDSKETIRTIEHYKQVLFEGDNSVMNVIVRRAQQEYDVALSKIVCNKNEFFDKISEYIYLERLINDDSEAYDGFTIKVALLYLLENNSLSEPLNQLLQLEKDEFRFSVAKESSDRLIEFKDLLQLLTKNKEALNIHKEEFDLNVSFLTSLKTLTQLLIREDNINDLPSFIAFLKSSGGSHFVKSYHSALGGYSKVDVLTESMYYLSLLETFDKNDLVVHLNENIIKIEQDIFTVRAEIIKKLGELKNLLEESQGVSFYAEKLNKVVTGIGTIKRLLKENDCYSSYLIVSSFLAQFTEVLSNSTKFLGQISKVIQNIEAQKLKVDKIQEEIDVIYQDDLSSKLLSFKFPISRNNGYLWKRVFIKDNLKDKQEYSNLIGESKNYYNPFLRPTIFENKLTDFQNCLVSIYTKKEAEFNNLLNEIRSVHQQAQMTKKLEGFISQLLNVNE